MPGRNAGLHLDRKSSCPCARHEGERVSGGTARHKVEVSGQFHAPGKQSPVPTLNRRQRWVTEAVWMFWRRDKSLTLPGIEPRFNGRPSRSLVINPTMLPQLSLEFKLILSSSDTVRMYFKDPNLLCTIHTVHCHSNTHHFT